MAQERSSPADRGSEDHGLVGFVRDVKAAVLGAAAEATERGLAITGARLQVTSTLKSGPTGGIGAAGGIGSLLLDVAQISFHRQRSDSHQLDVAFEPPAPALAPAPRGMGGGRVAAGARPDTGAVAPFSRSGPPDSGPLAQQLADVVRSVTAVVGVLFAEVPACQPAGGAAGGGAGGAAGGAAQREAPVAASGPAGFPDAAYGGVPGGAGGPEVPLATMTLNLGVDEGGIIKLVVGGRREVQTTHILTLTFGRMRG